MYHLSSNPGPKRWQICTGCLCCLEAPDQMPSPVFDFNPIWNFSRNINSNLFIIDPKKLKNGPVDLNRALINFRPIKDQVPRSYFWQKSFQYFKVFSWMIVRVTERMMSMKMVDNKRLVTSTDHAISRHNSDLSDIWLYTNYFKIFGVRGIKVNYASVIKEFCSPDTWPCKYSWESLKSELCHNVTYGFPFLQIITARARIRFVSILSLADI